MSLAIRKYELKGSLNSVVITIHSPIEFNGHSECRYKIEGLSQIIERNVHGVDNLQVIFFCIRAISQEIELSPEYKDGLISWFGESDLGLFS